jgi:hypothetical protein
LNFQRANTLMALGHGAGSSVPRPDRLAAALPGIRALPHRLEDLGLHRGVRVIDNGVSTIARFDAGGFSRRCRGASR